MLQLEKELTQIETKLESLVEETQKHQLEQLTSIPGMGKKTAMLLIVLTDGFASLENTRKLCL
tara:strand:- start:111 stop:299 length:189 start_codon:yes stop_codon:yes gene_type:complete